MGVVLVLACWVSTLMFFFGAKILALYDVLVSVLTHVVPLGPIVAIVAIVALIVSITPKRPMED